MKKSPEMDLCRSLATYLKLQYPNTEYRFDQAGNNLSKAQAGLNKAIQKSKSWPDLFIAEPKNGYHGLFIEIKAPGIKLHKKNGEWANEHYEAQNKKLEKLREKGYFTTFGIGLDETIKIIDNYMQ